MQTEITASFCKNLKKYRELSDYTQQQLGEKTGYTVGFISELETGKKKPSYETVAVIAGVLEVSMDQLTYGEGKQTDNAFIEDIMMCRSKMSDKTRKLADHLGLKLYMELARMEDEM